MDHPHDLFYIITLLFFVYQTIHFINVFFDSKAVDRLYIGYIVEHVFVFLPHDNMDYFISGLWK